MDDRITSGELTVRLLPSSFMLLNQRSQTLIDRGADNPSKTVGASCLSGALAGIGLFRDPWCSTSGLPSTSHRLQLLSLKND